MYALDENAELYVVGNVVKAREFIGSGSELKLADEQIARWQAFRARHAKGDCQHPMWVQEGSRDVYTCHACKKIILENPVVWKMRQDEANASVAALQSQIDRLSGADEAHAEAIQRMHQRLDTDQGADSAIDQQIGTMSDGIKMLRAELRQLTDRIEGNESSGRKYVHSAFTHNQKEFRKLHERIDALQDQAEGAVVELNEDEKSALQFAVTRLSVGGATGFALILERMAKRLSK